MKHRTEGHTETTISGDTRADWSEAFELVPSLQIAYVWHASVFTREVLNGLRIGFLYPHQIIWNKGRTVQKSGELVFLPMPHELKMVLDALPLPRNAAQDCPYYFWNGQTSRRAVVGIAERTLAAVFKKSGVKDAHAHRYRHTLATRLLAEGATFEAVADILGNTPEIVRKHYGKWSNGRQDTIDRLMMMHFQSAGVTNPVTKKSHANLGAVN